MVSRVKLVYKQLVVFLKYVLSVIRSSDMHAVGLKINKKGEIPLYRYPQRIPNKLSSVLESFVLLQLNGIS